MDEPGGAIPSAQRPVPVARPNAKTLPQAPAPAPAPTEAMKRAGVAFEAAFLDEMLRHSGLGDLRGMAGGSTAESQIGPMMSRFLAERLAEGAGIGIAPLVAARLAEAAQMAERGAAVGEESADLVAPIPRAAPGGTE
ncbi:MAG: hypothetical protein AAF899_05775 [Pseudomonadota bacterium]